MIIYRGVLYSGVSTTREVTVIAEAEIYKQKLLKMFFTGHTGDFHPQS